METEEVHSCDECKLLPERTKCPCGMARFCSNDCHVSAWIRWHRLRCPLENASFTPLCIDEWTELSHPTKRNGPGLFRYVHTERPLVRYGWYPRTKPGCITEDGRTYIPVVRYENDASGPTFVEWQEHGISFSYEPSSSTWLDVSRHAIFHPTILSAFFALRKHLDESEDGDGFLADDAAPYRWTLPWYACGGGRCDGKVDDRETIRFGKLLYGWFPRSFDEESVPTFDVTDHASLPPGEGVVNVTDDPSHRRVPGRTCITPLSPSFGSSARGVFPPDSLDRLRTLTCAAARAAGINTIVIAFSPDPDGTRVSTEVITVDRSPYSRLVWSASSVSDETAAATLPFRSRSDRLNRGSVAFTSDGHSVHGTPLCDTEPSLSTVWFPDDGLLYGRHGAKLVPYFDESDGTYIGLDLRPHSRGTLVSTSQFIPS